MSKVPDLPDPRDAEAVTGDGLAETMLSQQARGDGSPANLLPGTRFGGDDGRRFELVEKLGHGGMGSVFLARDHLLDRPIAIKFILLSEWNGPRDEMVALFRQEARATARLNHEGIMRLFDLGTYLGMPFLVMEYLEGQTLASIAARERLDALRATRTMTEVARGLAHAHRTGIVHRDLKPTNIFIVKDGHPKILDFGLATVLRGPGALKGAGTSSSVDVVGTPQYMSPEQWRGETQDGRTDLWALGVMFFELLTGRALVDSRQIEEIRSRMLSDEPLPRVREFRPDLPAEADELVARALNKDIRLRFATADAFLSALVALEVVLSRMLRAPSHGRTTEVGAPAIVQRQVSLTSCTIGNATALYAEHDVGTVSALLETYVEAVRTIVGQLEGTLLTAAGGRIVACFGYPIAREDDAQRAVRAGMLIADAVGDLNEQSGVGFALKVGIHTGTVLIGKTGDGDTPALQGDALELVAWVERQAPPDRIVISARTAALTSWLFELASLGARTPDTGGQPIELFQVTGQRAMASRFERAARVGLTPLVGREDEMGALSRLWAEAASGQSHFAIVSGEAGIGKSRLVEAIKEHVLHEGGRALTGQCWSYFQNTAFQPLIEIVQQVMDISHSDSAATRLAKLESSLRRWRLDVDEHLPLLANLLSLPPGGSVPALSLSPDVFRFRLIDSLSALILGLAAERPTLVLIEDAHWSDASTQELLTTLLDRIGNAQLLVVLTCRPQFASAFPGRARVHEFNLNRLPPDATATMVANASRGVLLPPDIVAALVRRADGIPLFVEELTRMLVDTSEQSEGGSPAAGANITVQSIPATLSELLLARLDQLAGAGKEVAQLGAVLGREFTFEVIDRCSHLDRDSLRGGLMQLVEADLIRHEERGSDAQYVFKHALVQEAAYGSLLKSERRTHHQRVAETFEREFTAVAERQPELLAHHFLEGGAPASALPYLEKSGQRAVQRSAHIDAIAHYWKAIEIVSRAPESVDRNHKELALRLALGAPLMANKGYAHADVEANYARALELSRELGDDSQIFIATLGLWQFSLVVGRTATGVELGERLMAQAMAAHDDNWIMLAHRSLGTSLMLMGEPAKSCEHTTAGLAMYDVQKHGKLGFRFGHDPGVAHGLYRGLTLWLLGRADEALQASSEALALAEKLDHPMSIAFAACFVAVVENMRGEHVSARVHATAGLALSSQHQLALWKAMNRIALGWADAGERRPDGNGIMADGIDGLIRTGAKASLTLFDAAQAWGLLALNRHQDALRAVNAAEAWVDRTGEVFFMAELARLKGEALLATSTQTEESERLFEQALAIARQQNARAFELRAATSLARLLAGLGRRSDALLCLEPVYRQFNQGLGTADLVAARELIAELQSA